MDVIELWWLSLAIAAVVVVVVAVLLGLIIAAAKRIDRHAASIWVAGKKIAGNTVSIWMLEQANNNLAGIQKSVDDLTESVTTMDARLQRLTRSSGRKG